MLLFIVVVLLWGLTSILLLVSDPNHLLSDSSSSKLLALVLGPLILAPRVLQSSKRSVIPGGRPMLAPSAYFANHSQTTQRVTVNSAPQSQPVGTGQSNQNNVILANHYRVERILGSGGFGKVYLATDLRTNTSVALKCLPANTKAQRDEIKHEVSILKRCASSCNFLPEIRGVEFYDNGLQEFAYVSMQFIDGENLAEDKQPWSPEAVEKFLNTMLEYLEKLSELEVVHRDIKPNNIIRTPGGRLMIVDLGIAKMNLQTESAVQGRWTPIYVSPEQAAGESATHRSDLYSLGVTAYELATRSVLDMNRLPLNPFGDLKRSLPPLRRYIDNPPRQLERTLQRLTQRNVRRRPPDATAARRMLKRRPRRVQAYTEALVLLAAPILALLPAGRNLVSTGAFIGIIILAPLCGIMLSELLLFWRKRAVVAYYVLIVLGGFLLWLAGLSGPAALVMYTNFWSAAGLCLVNLAFLTWRVLRSS